ncbi:hypothetical protein HQ535_03070 [bacterium]|nr:hypothetical protein [bacterium]
MRSPRTLFVALAVILAVSACGDDDSVTTSTAGATTSSSSTRPTSGDTGQELAPELQELVEAAERVRGLSFLVTPTITQLAPDDFQERVRGLIEDEIDLEELAIDQALFELLGILDPGTDLGQAFSDLYAEQVGGFYDDDAGEMVVPTGEEITPLFKTIIVHELIHALQDQHFRYSDIHDRLIEEELSEESAALQALLEGDAQYFQLVYFEEMTTDEQVAVITESLAVDTTMLDSLPGWLGESLYFPYDQGYNFVERLVVDGGIAGVDAAYERIPTTTEQIMHPGKYSSLEGALPVSLPDTAVDGYEVVREDVFGEWSTDLVLLDGVSDGTAVVAAAGWGGDAFRLFWNGVDVALVLEWVGETPRDAEELEAALVSSLRSSMNVGQPQTDSDAGTSTMVGGDYAFVDRDRSTVVLVIAGDPTVGALLATAVAVG